MPHNFLTMIAITDRQPDAGKWEDGARELSRPTRRADAQQSEIDATYLASSIPTESD